MRIGLAFAAVAAVAQLPALWIWWRGQMELADDEVFGDLYYLSIDWHIVILASGVTVALAFLAGLATSRWGLLRP